MWVDEGAECGLDGAGDAPSSLHVLLAEDDTPSLCILNRLLTACGYRGARQLPGALPAYLSAELDIDPNGAPTELSDGAAVSLARNGREALDLLDSGRNRGPGSERHAHARGTRY